MKVKMFVNALNFNEQIIYSSIECLFLGVIGSVVYHSKRCRQIEHRAFNVLNKLLI